MDLSSVSPENYLNYKRSRQAKVVIYTAISDGFDELIQHKYISKDFDYVCYTDTPITNPGIWDIRPLEYRGYDNNRNAKYYKLFPDILFPDYEYSIWIDGNIDLLDNDLENRVNYLIENGNLISANIHFERNCVYEEAYTCIKYQLDDPFIIQSFVQYLKDHNYPYQIGLFEMNIIFRNHHNFEIIALMHDWWKMIIRFSKRDQLSFMYALYQNKMHCEAMYPMSHRKRKGFLFKPHNRSIVTTLFVDIGNGFILKDTIMEHILIRENNNFSAIFNLSDFSTIKSLCFILLSGGWCKIRLQSIVYQSKIGYEVELDLNGVTSNGALGQDGYILFKIQEAMFHLPLTGEIKQVEISGEIEVLTAPQVEQEVQQAVERRFLHSYTWRIGRIFTWIPARIANYIK